MTSGNVSVKEMDNTAIYTFDTESEDEEDSRKSAPVRSQPKPQVVEDEVELSMKNISEYTEYEIEGDRVNY